MLNSPLLSHFLSFTVSLAVDTSVDLLISDSPTTAFPIQDPGPAPTQQPTAPSATTHKITTTTKSAATTIKQTAESTPTSTPKPTTTKLTATSRRATSAKTTVQPTTPVSQGTTKTSNTNINIGPPTAAFSTAGSWKERKSQLSWTESPADQPKTTKKPGRDTYTVV